MKCDLEESTHISIFAVTSLKGFKLLVIGHMLSKLYVEYNFLCVFLMGVRN